MNNRFESNYIEIYCFLYVLRISANAFTLSGSRQLLLAVTVFDAPLKALSEEHDVAGLDDIFKNNLNKAGKHFLC